ncbi:MAG: hypothetical protein H8E44_48445 [Planctomycetes bacterium]|nr:hypothetical protein [Planctomycetota bacterium]MBL7037062.1 hypothetical protein [Pirellulaceae bacterium]
MTLTVKNGSDKLTLPDINSLLCYQYSELAGFPGDDVLASDCNLDELRVQDDTVASRLEGAPEPVDCDLDEARLLQEMDLARATLDKLVELQFRGGWAASYGWPIYTPSGYDGLDETTRNGSGWLTMFVFDEAKKTITRFTFSPLLGVWATDRHRRSSSAAEESS